MTDTFSSAEAQADIIGLTTEIVSAYVSNNAISPTDLSRLIADVHSSMSALSQASAPVETEEPQKPAVPIKKSMTQDYLICLEDGKKFRSLKRHLATYYGLSPDQYRAKWGLHSDYPMVAPSYSEQRSNLAKKAGLGRKSG